VWAKGRRRQFGNLRAANNSETDYLIMVGFFYLLKVPYIRMYHVLASNWLKEVGMGERDNVALEQK